MTSERPMVTLCNKCSQIFLSDREVDKKYPYTCYVWPYLQHETLLLPDPAFRNCHLCASISSEVRKVAMGEYTFMPPLPKYPPNPGYDMEVQISTGGHEEQRRVQLQFFVPSRDQVILYLDMVNTEDNWAVPYLFETELAQSTNSDASWRICHRWLSLCNMNHGGCNALRTGGDKDDPWVPSRLLYVGLDSTGGKRCVKLCEAVNVTGHVNYAALSHCWGTLPLLKLTLSSLPSFKRGIPMIEMPLTFKDAIFATRKLGLQYLWIDSLCIIQDSDLDWRKESSMMFKIYRRSYVNLAGTKSKDSTGGLFVSRDPLSVTPCAVKMQCKGCPGGVYYGLPSSQMSWEATVAKSPLNARAWVFQERLLAVRTLHFTVDKLYWECCQLQATEAFPFGQNIFDSHPEIYGMSLKQEYNLIRLTRQDIDVGRFWGSIVMRYSNLALTRQTDVLIALSGIAAELGQVLGASDRYLAGTWFSQLPNMLLWEMLKEGKEPATYLAPSWSWASLTGSAVHAHKFWARGDSLVNISEVETTPIADPYGQISRGFIRLRGTLIKASVSIEPGRPDLSGIIMHDRSSVVHLGGPRAILSLECENYRVIEVNIDRGLQSLLKSEVFCLLVMYDSFFKCVHGLVLELTGTKKDQYHRVGICEIKPVDEMADNRKLSTNTFKGGRLDDQESATIEII